MTGVYYKWLETKAGHHWSDNRATFCNKTAN